jgi:hypothetical protein
MREAEEDDTAVPVLVPVLAAARRVDVESLRRAVVEEIIVMFLRGLKNK